MANAMPVVAGTGKNEGTEANSGKRTGAPGPRWTAFYWGDYARDTKHLSLAQHGAYLQLMLHYYSTRRPLPTNVELLHHICSCTTDAEKLAVEQVVAEFFVRQGDVYRHERIETEIAKSKGISEVRRNARLARLNGNSANVGTNVDTNVKDLSPVCALQSQSQSQSQSQKEKSKTSTSEVETSDKKPRREPSEAAWGLARLMLAEIRCIKPDFKFTDAALRRWADVADLMLRIDKRDPARVADLIRRIYRDTFWQRNVLSMGTLREKYDQLELKLVGAKRPLAKLFGSLFGNLFSFGQGGIMTAHGALALHRYDLGGVAMSPQLALFGESSRAEAYVPLPDGRSIPVTMRGAGGANIYVDARGADAAVEYRVMRAVQIAETRATARAAAVVEERQRRGYAR
jgi:uncharacterized protein YdaU (DUF1376 family)